MKVKDVDEKLLVVEESVTKFCEENARLIKSDAKLKPEVVELGEASLKSYSEGFNKAFAELPLSFTI